MCRLMLCCLSFFVVGSAILSAESPEGYQTRKMQGWTVHISEKLLSDDAEATKQAVILLDAQFELIVARLPKHAVVKMRTVPIWLSPTYEGFRPTGEYHPNRQWLIDNGRRAELAKCIEFSNTPIFEREIKRMPVLLLHELAHAYHDQVLGFDRADIIAAYRDAKQRGIYDSVERDHKRKDKAYAIVNHKEYFAECTEAFFGTNDFYPYTRDELEDHDPLMFRLLTKIWAEKY